MKGREQARSVSAKNAEWREFLTASRPHVLSQQSTLYTEAFCVKDLKLWGMASESLPVGESSAAIYEMFRYRLAYGARDAFIYEIVTKQYDQNKDPSSHLCTVLESYLGDTSSVLCVWRHGGGIDALTRTRLAMEKTGFNVAVKGLVTDLHITQYNTSLFSTWK